MASLIAIAGVIGYVIADVVLQFLPPHYTAISQAESDLAVGPFGWIMSINFFWRWITSAVLIAFFLLALAAFWVLTFWTRARSRAADVFLGVASVGLVFLGTAIVAIPAVLGVGERICLAGILGWVFVVARYLAGMAGDGHDQEQRRENEI